MTEKVFHFVRHHEVAAFERVGWLRHDSLEGTHHGTWSTLMEWRGQGEPVKPFFIDASRETFDEDAEHLASAVADLNDELARCAG